MEITIKTTMATNFISDEQMNNLVSTGKASTPSFIPDAEANNYFGQPTTMEQPQETGFVQGLAQGIAKPALRIISNIRSAVPATENFASALFGQKPTKQIPQEYYYGYLGNVKPIGQEGNLMDKVADSLGVGAELASYGVTGGGVSSTIGKGLLGKVATSLLSGAKTGAVGGGLMTFGQSLQEAENSPSDIAYKTLFGATSGAALGGALGSFTPIAIKGANFTKKLKDINAVNSTLEQLNQKVFNPTKSQLTEWTKFGKNPIKTYTELFGTEVPMVDRDNRFTSEGIKDLSKRVSNIYEPAANAFNAILRNSPEVNSIKSAEQKAFEGLDFYKLTPDMKEKAKSLISSKIEAVKREASNNGVLLGEDSIPVSYSDNLKDRFWGATKNFGTDDASISNAVNSSLGHAFKDSIENSISDINIKNYNKHLGDLIVLRDFLDTKANSLAGTGGKMTRLMTRIVGSVAGSKGGPIGSILGSLTGDKLAQIMIDPKMQPYRWLVAERLNKLPKSQLLKLEEEANNVIRQMQQRRMETLTLPPAGEVGSVRNPIITPNTQGTPSLTDMSNIGEFRQRTQPQNSGETISATTKPITTENIK